MLFEFSKQPAEEVTRAVDFSGTAEIQAGENIVAHTVEITLNGQVAEGILVSSALDGSLVKFRVRGGDHGGNYKITVLVTTNAGHVREADVMMYVRER
jgi:hypothetical protein